MFQNFTEITLAIQRTKIAQHVWEADRELQANKRKLQGQSGWRVMGFECEMKGNWHCWGLHVRKNHISKSLVM